MSIDKVIVAEPLLWGGQGFAMFGAWHLLWLAICATVIALLVHGYRSLPADDSWRGGRRWLVLVAAIVPNALLLWGDVLKVRTGTFSPNWWPLHLCNIAEYICLWHALAPSRVTRELLLCFGLTGGLCAMLFPGWTSWRSTTCTQLPGGVTRGSHLWLPCSTWSSLGGLTVCSTPTSAL